MNITDLSLDDRPREKFAAHGAATLSKAELLAILIGSGNTEENAVQLMQRIMNDCQGSLATLGNMGIDSLCRYKGMGPAKAISVLAACELGRRRMAEGMELRPQLTSSADIFAYMTPRLKGTPVEECHAILLNNHLRVVGCKLISRGGITGTVVDVRLVLREAAVALVLLAPVDDEAAAASALAEFQALADSLLSSGSSPDGSVKFVNWTCDELFDQELLADQQILRSQIDVSCTILDALQ